MGPTSRPTVGSASSMRDLRCFLQRTSHKYPCQLPKHPPFGRLTRMGNECSRQGIVFETGGRIDHDAPRRSDHSSTILPPLALQSKNSPTHHSLSCFAYNRTTTTTKIYSGKPPILRFREKVNEAQVFACKQHASTRNTWTRGPCRREEKAMRVMGPHPPIAADLLFPGRLFVSENPPGFRPNTLFNIHRLRTLLPE